MRKLQSISSKLYDNHLIIPMSKNWIDVFDGIPDFDVMIDAKNRLCIISKEEINHEK